MAESKPKPSRKPKFLQGPSPIEFMLLGIIVVAIVLLYTQDWQLVVKVFYSRFSFLILVIMIFELLVLKSSDRSKVYRKELERLREFQGANLKIVREVDARLEDAAYRAGELREAGRAGAEDLTALHEQLQQTLTQLRSRK